MPQRVVRMVYIAYSASELVSRLIAMARSFAFAFASVSALADTYASREKRKTPV